MSELRAVAFIGTCAVLVGCAAVDPPAPETSESPPADADPGPVPGPMRIPEEPSPTPDDAAEASAPTPDSGDPRSRAAPSTLEEADPECPYLPARIGPTINVELDECVRDEDCGTLAVCTTGNGHRVCVPRCETHDDCGTGERCACVGRQASFGSGRYGMCIPALCNGSHECGEGLRCLVTNRQADPLAPPLSFVCETPEDECDWYSPVWATPSCVWSEEGRKLAPRVS